MRSPEGKEYCVQGVYRELAPPERLSFTWAWEDEDGNPGHETVVTVTLEARGQKTALTLRHSLFESKEACDRHREGWTSTLECLAEHLG
jgi:uncharacterized protein YndB with AHSA1/START domain